MITLPERYCDNMRALLGEEYQEYVKSLSQKPCTAFRINTGRLSVEEWKQRNPFSTSQIAWTEKGFYFDAQKEQPSKHPYYYAGMYYIQEPSAMIPASILPVSLGDKVLDLCAAPGGKATELGAKLAGSGLLVANDISVSRTMALAKNLQMAGITNAVVTAETPERLASVFTGYFDKILIDAPCSGEGMFRREPRMIKDWTEKGPEYYAPLQRQILEKAYQMLKPGGKLVYSTCTFSVKEDEENVQWFLNQYPDMKICPLARREGFCEGRPDLVPEGIQELVHCVRIFPHKAKGEGHFAVLLQKEGQENLAASFAAVPQEEPENLAAAFVSAQKEWLDREEAKSRKGYREKRGSHRHQSSDRRGGQEGLESETAVQAVEDFLKQLKRLQGRVVVNKHTVSVQPFSVPETGHLRIVYEGIPVCGWKHKLQPSQQLALTWKEQDYQQAVSFAADDERVIRYLKGETLLTDTAYKGNVLVCVDGFGLGWAQGSGNGTLKNRYYPGWRYQ